MARIIDIHFDHVGRTDGCTCGRCGQWLQNIWTVKFDDGITAHFGIDCFEKMCKDSRLNDYGMKLMKKTLKRLEDWEKRLAEWESGAITADNCIAYQNEQVDDESYWQGKSFEEYKEFEIHCIRDCRIPEVKKELEKFRKVNFQR